VNDDEKCSLVCPLCNGAPMGIGAYHSSETTVRPGEPTALDRLLIYPSRLDSR
jgi:hypothetical protein